MKHQLRFRQIHLDFHTHGSIPDVGVDFDPVKYAKTLADAHVDSVTTFARCHHGWLYYDSKNQKDRIHPNLKNKKLLKEQIDACHAVGIKVPIYTTIQWDEQVAHDHYDWLCVNEMGAPFKQRPFEAGFYRNICLNSPYVDYQKIHIKDLFESLGNLDGLFLDILNIKPCCCNHCLDEMRERGLDAADEIVRYEFAQFVFDRFQLDMTEYIHSIQPDCPVFYNVGYLGTQHRNALDSFTHIEIESLPGGSWGYDHFPVTAKYARNLGFDFMGMTGKFHTDWGDFGSLKNQSALEYECFKALAYGGKCSIGDQLHPRGELNQAAYELIGNIYKSVEEKEPWCKDATPVCEAAIFTPSEFKRAGTQLVTPELTGAVKMLSEIGLQFDVVDSFEDISRYKLVILPDEVSPMSDKIIDILNTFVENGGAILTSYKSGTVKNITKKVDFLAADICEDVEYSPDYIDMKGELATGLPETEFVMYEKAINLQLRDGSQEVLGTNIPYFNRTWEHYCSHRHTPSSGEYGYPAVIKKGKVYQFAHPIFTIYEKYCPNFVKQVVKNAICNLIGAKLVSHNGPSTLELSLMHQNENKRYVLHAIHYIPVRKCEKMDIIEDTIPLDNTEICVIVGSVSVKSVKIVPSGLDIEFTHTDNTLGFIIPCIEGHTMVEICY